MPSIGVLGQERIVSARVLVVGAGGLGSPCLLYLAAAGVGRIGILDYDTLESSNLQRQVVHNERGIGLSKADSAVEAIKRLNSLVTPIAHNLMIDSTNAMQIISNYDIVVDCTDNAVTRYLLNDSCVLSKKPLVSGGALKWDGQLTVYNHRGGPCYRCLFPIPPDPSLITNCNQGGILGAGYKKLNVVTGIIGSTQALEVIKLICNGDSSFSQRMLILDAETGMFKCVKLRPRQINCEVCGDNPTITKLIDYTQFCNASPNDKVLLF
jgi:adenylyltransferase/sulfurtransferase